MSRWYNDRQRFRLERERLVKDHPFLRLVIASSGFVINTVLCFKEECAIVHGTYELEAADGMGRIDYRIVVVLPNNYPKACPLLFCDDPKLPIGNIDRHILANGQACLGVHAEIGARWADGSSLLEFLKNIVRPFLVWQAHYDLYGEAPSWGERAHSEAGIISFYKEILEIEDDRIIPAFMGLLARKNYPQGHENCPCGSGKRLRDCHRKIIDATRKRVAAENVQKDIAALASFSKAQRGLKS